MTATRDERAAPTSDDRVRVRQFNADRHDQSLGLDDALAAKPTERQLVWIDIADEIDPAQVLSARPLITIRGGRVTHRDGL